MTDKAYPARLRARIESRDTRLQGLGYRDYQNYLDSTQWARVKAHFRKLVIEACGLCGSEDALVLHHLTYERVGEESPFDLTWLCQNCHQMVHVLERRGDMGLDFAGLADFERAAEYAQAQAVRKDESSRHRGEIERSEEHIRKRLTRLKAQITEAARRIDYDTFDAFLEDTEGRLKSLESQDEPAIAPGGERLGALDPAYRRTA